MAHTPRKQTADTKKLKQNQENFLKLVLMCVDSALAISMQALWMVNDLAGCL
jgi:hypothetical protein